MQTGGIAGQELQMIVLFILGNSPASEFYIQTFGNTRFHLHKQVGMKNDWVWECCSKLLQHSQTNHSSCLSGYEDGTVCSETSAYKIQTPGNYPEESIRHSEQDEISWSCSQAVNKHVWHIPLPCVQWKTADDVERICPKHVEFYSKNKFEKLVHLFGVIIRIFQDSRSPERETVRSLFMFHGMWVTLIEQRIFKGYTHTHTYTYIYTYI